jgi:hypothetical protein
MYVLLVNTVPFHPHFTQKERSQLGEVVDIAPSFFLQPNIVSLQIGGVRPHIERHEVKLAPACTISAIPVVTANAAQNRTMFSV